MKKWFNYFIYISIIFLIVFLVRADYFVVPVVRNVFHLVLAFVFVFIGFFLDAYSWYKALHLFNCKQVKYLDCVASEGLSIFGKYIPGKIWVILGRSAYISKRYDLNEKEVASISLNVQFVSLWSALLLGILGLAFIQVSWYIVLGSIALLIIFSLILFTPLFHRLFTVIMMKLLRKRFDIPQLTISSVLFVLPFSVLCWLTWCLGFWFLAISLVPEHIPLFAGLFYALGASLGMIAIILPGGLGMREGLLSLTLIAAGLASDFSVTVSVSSRLWYLIGEGFIFFTGLIISRFYKLRK
ncbi:MAG: flippase-like domain-containing protein [Bacteroidales bacterium]|nr:flippase-like domain-containing protein [Bacteroidales bacterium]HOY37662.1 lysylphosphatidylglycerol synthase domain-containing protein [Bacteroidales bacterium]HQP04186.1 lysylphosphatidylglycerol synthase domain-containing protein [Bacteroidales bacterium]